MWSTEIFAALDIVYKLNPSPLALKYYGKFILHFYEVVFTWCIIRIISCPSSENYYPGSVQQGPEVVRQTRTASGCFGHGASQVISNCAGNTERQEPPQFALKCFKTQKSDGCQASFSLPVCISLFDI